jgi:energy-coupling factor transport system ATP-binding protein
MALKAVGMESYATSAPHMLSGGQKQRIAIAGLLAMQPEVLVLDEATSMLDPAGKAEVLSIVQRLNSEGITIVMITQYMEEATIADRVIVMADGEIALQGTPKQVFSQAAALRGLRLDVPAVVDLRNRLIAKGMRPTHALNAKDFANFIAEALGVTNGD